MEPNDALDAKKNSGSQTTFKGFGIEFSGPSWVALAVLAAAVIGGAIYVSNHGQNEDAGQEVTATTNDASGEAAPAESHDTPTSDTPSTEDAQEPAAAAGEEK